MSAAAAVREYERHTTGSETIYRHWLRLKYTEGVKFLADECGALLIAFFRKRRGRVSPQP